MATDDGLIVALQLDGKGSAAEVGWEDIRRWSPDGPPLWIHLDYTGTESGRWLTEESGLDPATREALQTPETRPRSVVTHDGLLVILRGVNLNPGADPEDMVSLRIWVEAKRVITLRSRRLLAVDDVCTKVTTGDGPKDSAEVLVVLADALTNRMGSVLSDLDDDVDALEDEVLSGESYELRAKIGAFRRCAISMRRYLAPQRDVLGHLYGERVSWLTDMHRVELREIADRTTRYVEDLDSARDRAAVSQDELNSRLSEQMNHTMYVLSIVAAVFLPLGLFTGLLGINVGGIPGTENPWAFLIVCVLLVVIAIGLLVVFRRKRWI
jgi:zinc transporter